MHTLLRNLKTATGRAARAARTARPATAASAAAATSTSTAAASARALSTAAAAAAGAAKGKAPLRWCFLGAPGVGKGTFASRIAPHFGIPTISSGDLIRAEIKSGSALGAQIKATNDAGQLVSDDIVTRMIQTRLSQPDTQKGFILDGYPRRVTQAEALGRFTKLDLVLNIDLREDILVLKAVSRRVCGGCGKGYNVADIQNGEIRMPPLLPKKEGICDKCGGKLVQRSDDTEAIVRDRLAVYHRETKPLIDYYKRAGTLVHFDVKKGLDDVPELIRLLTTSSAAAAASTK